MVALAVFLPLIFVAVGASGIYGVWRRTPNQSAEGRPESISQRARGTKDLGRKIELGLGLLFSVVGGGLTIFLLVVPVFRLIQASTWVETPAVVKASTLRSWSTDDGTSYRADVLYEYTVGGGARLSNRRTFFPPNSGGYDGARAIVDSHPEGSSTTCYVDPEDPTRSVLDRGFHGEYLIGLFPLVFLLAGLGLTVHALRTRRKSASASPVQETTLKGTPRTSTLKPDAGPIAKVIGMLLVAAIWNGIVSIFVWQVVQGWRNGNPEWFLTIFLIPFVLVGLALIGGIFYTFLASFNPRPRLTISPSAPRAGDSDCGSSGRSAVGSAASSTSASSSRATKRRPTAGAPTPTRIVRPSSPSRWWIQRPSGRSPGDPPRWRSPKTPCTASPRRTTRWSGRSTSTATSPAGPM